ncbi:hypothetical protein [Streptomyces phaeoluteigriseus]|uniref:hypothetical protein n=1 Tax=Streptomyces phaeoluteigriseus TaxID=114686 RepID=UPI0036CB546F
MANSRRHLAAGSLDHLADGRVEVRSAQAGQPTAAEATMAVDVGIVAPPTTSRSAVLQARHVRADKPGAFTQSAAPASSRSVDRGCHDQP